MTSALAAALLLAAAAAPPPALRPGVYEDMMLAVGPGGQVTARIYEERGTGPYFSCEVLFAGRAGPGGRVAGVSWAQGEAAHPATLRPTADGVVIDAPGASDYPGCGMTMGEILDQPDEESLTAPARWTALLRVTAPRAVLRPAPADGARRPYLVRGDVVGLVGARPGWLEVDYLAAAGRRVHGWLRPGEAAAITPPAPARR